MGRFSVRPFQCSDDPLALSEAKGQGRAIGDNPTALLKGKDQGRAIVDNPLALSKEKVQGSSGKDQGKG